MKLIIEMENHICFAGFYVLEECLKTLQFTNNYDEKVLMDVNDSFEDCKIRTKVYIELSDLDLELLPGWQKRKNFATVFEFLKAWHDPKAMREVEELLRNWNS